MPKKNKMSNYYYHSEPVKDEYVFGDDRGALIEFAIDDCKLRLYKDETGFIEMLRIEIINPDRDPDLIAYYLKQYVQAVLRLCYVTNFKFSRFASKTIDEFDDGMDKPKVNTGKIVLTKERRNPAFDSHVFLQQLQLFSKKPLQLDLFTSKLDFIDDPIGCYANLYKIIEFEFHLSDDSRNTKVILKESNLKDIAAKFSYEGKTGDALIGYIVDLRHKCDHLKDSRFGTKFGFSSSNIDDVKEVQKFIPIMRKICAQVIDSGFEILD